MTKQESNINFSTECAKFEKFTLTWERGFVFRIDVHEASYLELADIEEIQNYKTNVTKGMPYCVLFVCPSFGNLSREAREFLATPAANKNAIAKAVFTPNMGTRILTDFFILINKPPVAHKAFTQLDEAYEWMTAQIQKR